MYTLLASSLSASIPSITMGPEMDIVELRSELRTIEELTNDLRQRKMALCTRIARLEPADTVNDAFSTPPPAALNSTPFPVPAVKGAKMTLPLYESFGPGCSETSLLPRPSLHCESHPESESAHLLHHRSHRHLLDTQKINVLVSHNQMNSPHENLVPLLLSRCPLSTPQSRQPQ